MRALVFPLFAAGCGSPSELSETEPPPHPETGATTRATRILLMVDRSASLQCTDPSGLIASESLGCVESVGEGDSVALLTFDHRVQTTPFGASMDTLRAAFGPPEGVASDFEGALTRS